MENNPEDEVMKAKINKQNYIKPSLLYMTQETTNKVKRQSTEWVKIFADYATDKGIIFQTYITVKKLTNKISNLVKKWANDMNRPFSNDEIKMAKSNEKNA